MSRQERAQQTLQRSATVAVIGFAFVSLWVAIGGFGISRLCMEDSMNASSIACRNWALLAGVVPALVCIIASIVLCLKRLYRFAIVVAAIPVTIPLLWSLWLQLMRRFG